MPAVATPVVTEEQILVLPTELFHQIGHFQGFSAELERYLPALLDDSQLSYRPRGAMEQDPSFKQLIPYCLFRHTDSGGVVRLFSYLRGKGGGEARLRAKRSVGVGGHISSVDAAGFKGTGGASHHVYREGLERELAEEIVIDTPFRETCVGLINDDETDVGRVHIGVVHLFDVEQPNVASREDDLTDPQFIPVSEILGELEGYESWSQIAVRALFA
jgi:predicted NUDIX family phosphoesterase